MGCFEYSSKAAALLLCRGGRFRFENMTFECPSQESQCPKLIPAAQLSRSISLHNTSDVGWSPGAQHLSRQSSWDPPTPLNGTVERMVARACPHTVGCGMTTCPSHCHAFCEPIEQGAGQNQCRLGCQAPRRDRLF